MQRVLAAGAIAYAAVWASDGADRLSDTMSTTNDLRFAMAVHLLRKSNPATRQAVHRTVAHRGRDPTAAGADGPAGELRFRAVGRHRLTALQRGQALSGAFGLVVEFAVAALG